jgi:hypothetical protein
MIIRTSKLEESTTVTEEKGKLILDKVVNLEPYLQSAKEQRHDVRNGWFKDRSMRKVASIPFEVWHQWTRLHPELIAGDKELREKVLHKLLYQEEAKPFWTVEKGI